MRNILVVARRELVGYLRTPMGWVIAAVVLALDGLLFNVFALGAGRQLSAEVIGSFFYFSFGTTMFAAVMLSMRLFAEEEQTGTRVLLRTAPVGDGQVVLGKFCGAYVYLLLVTLVTVPMPLLVMVHGKISVGHLAAGYLGLSLAGAAALAIGTFGSAVANNQLVAVVASAAMVVGLLVCWLLAKVTEAPISDVFAHLAFFDKHFVSFQRGVVHTRDIVFYGSVTYLFLLLSAWVLRARRWA